MPRVQRKQRFHDHKKNIAGVKQNKPRFNMLPWEALEIDNMHSDGEGAWTADKVGYEHKNATNTAYESGASIRGLAHYEDDDEDDHLFMSINGKIKEVNLTTGADSNIDTSASLSTSNKTSFQKYFNKLYYCDGNIATPRVWDDSAAADSGGWPVSDGSNTYSKPKFVKQHQRRLLYLNFQGGTGASTKYPRHFILSDLGDGETFTQPSSAANHKYINELPGVGGPIVGGAVIPIPESNDDIAVIFERNATYEIFGRSAKSGDADEYRVVRVNDAYGALNDESIVSLGNEIFALSLRGVISYTAAKQGGTIQPVTINSSDVEDIISNINKSAVGNAWGIHLADRREIHWYVPTGSNTLPDRGIVLHYPEPGDEHPTYKWSTRSSAGVFKPTCGVLIDNDFYIGLDTGYVGHMFQSSAYGSHTGQSVAGTGIPWKFVHPPTDFGNPKQTKKITHAQALWGIRGDQTITARTRWIWGNGNNDRSADYTLNSSVQGDTYGTAVYGTGKYGEREEVKKEIYCKGDGERFQLELSGTTNTSGPTYLGTEYTAEYGGLSHRWN